MTIIMMTINLMFLFMKHPMSLALTLIIQTMIISLNSGMLMKTFWMSYILLITMLSGMLVIFIYMSSIASNEKFKINIKMWMLLFIFMIISLLFLFIEKKMIIKDNYLSMEMMVNKSMDIFYMNKLFNSKNMMITIMMVIYLFYTMIVSSYLINISEGPMRMKKYV